METDLNGRRMSDRQHELAYRLCAERDGEKCAHCGWTGGQLTRFQRRHMVAKDIVLELNHIDGDPENNNPGNWNLLCTVCNLFWRPIDRNDLRTGTAVGGAADEAGEIERRVGGEHETDRPAKGDPMTPGSDTPRPAKGEGSVEDMGVEERDRLVGAEKASATRRIRDEVPFREGDTTLQANARYEPAYRMYALTTVQRQKKVRWTDLEDGGAEHVGCSPGTAYRYLRKLTSPAGALMVVIEDGQRYVTMRPRRASTEAQR